MPDPFVLSTGALSGAILVMALRAVLLHVANSRCHAHLDVDADIASGGQDTAPGVVTVHAKEART